MIPESNSRSLLYSEYLHLSFQKLKHSVTNYCGTTPIFLKKYAYSPLPALLSTLLNVERLTKLFGIALMAACYIWQAQNLKSQH